MRRMQRLRPAVFRRRRAFGLRSSLTEPAHAGTKRFMASRRLIEEGGDGNGVRGLPPSCDPSRQSASSPDIGEFYPAFEGASEPSGRHARVRGQNGVDLRTGLLFVDGGAGGPIGRAADNMLRQRALSQAAEPEPIVRPFRVSAPHERVVLACLLTLLAIAAFWGVFGRVDFPWTRRDDARSRSGRAGRHGTAAERARPGISGGGRRFAVC